MGMGAARCICKTNAKLAINRRESNAEAKFRKTLSFSAFYKWYSLLTQRVILPLRAVILFGYASQ